MDLFLPTKAKTIAVRTDEIVDGIANPDHQERYNLKILKSEKPDNGVLKRENNKITRVYRGGVERIIGYKRNPDFLEVWAELTIDNLKTVLFSYEIPVEDK